MLMTICHHPDGTYIVCLLLQKEVMIELANMMSSKKPEAWRCQRSDTLFSLPWVLDNFKRERFWREVRVDI